MVFRFYLKGNHNVSASGHSANQSMKGREILACVLWSLQTASALQVLAMDNPPYVCPDWSPCPPAYPGSEWNFPPNLKNMTAWKSKPSDLLPGRH